MLKVTHGIGWYFPESTGGTEVYVSGLVKALRLFDIECNVVAPHTSETSADYEDDGIMVHRYPVGLLSQLTELRGVKPHQSVSLFKAWLAQQDSGVYHQHSWITSCGLDHVAAAKDLGLKTVFTLHVPANVCMRGTMMAFGLTPCDGRVDGMRCASCWAQGRGLPLWAANAVAHLPAAVSRVAASSGIENRAITALASRALVEVRKRKLVKMFEAADRIVAVCDWLAEALKLNGLASEKLVVSRQGVDSIFTQRQAINARHSSIFRLGVLARWDPIKGIHILFEALRRLPRGLAMELVIYAVANTDDDRYYRDKLLAQSTEDRRIKIERSVPRAELPDVLASFNMLAVPSQSLETGPLVVLEAQALGVPVIGSRLGGISELVTHGVDGYLVEAADPAAWADAIHRAVEGKLLFEAAPMPKPVRGMIDAAHDMAHLYRTIAH